MLGGAYNAPAGYQRRLMGGIIRVKERWVILLLVAVIQKISNDEVVGVLAESLHLVIDQWIQYKLGKQYL